MFSNNHFIHNFNRNVTKKFLLKPKCTVLSFSHSYTLLSKDLYIFPIFVRLDNLNIALSFQYFFTAYKGRI